MKPLSEFEADIAALAERFRQMPVGSTVTYEELDQVIGKPAKRHRYVLLRARDRVEKEDGSIFVTVFNVGVKRLAVEDYADVGSQARGAVRRKARRASQRMSNGLERANDVPGEVARAVGREQSILGLITLISTDKAMKKMLSDQTVTAPTPLGRAAADLMAALGIETTKE